MYVLLNFPTLLISYAHFLVLLSPFLPLFFSSFLSSINISWGHRVILSVALKNYSCCLRPLIWKFHSSCPMALQLKKLPICKWLLRITQDVQNSFILYFHFINLCHCYSWYLLLCLHVYLCALSPCDITSNAVRVSTVFHQGMLLFSLIHRNVPSSCFSPQFLSRPFPSTPGLL